MSHLSRGLLFFCVVPLLLVGFYLFRNTGLDFNALSSDVWAYQMLEMQQHNHYWSDIPPSYNQSELYIAFPLLYALSPGFEHGLVGYHVFAILLILAIYGVTGAVLYVLFKNWWLAALGGALMIIPRYIFPTQVGMLSVSQVRASTMLFPLYFLLSYYWVLRGINHPKQNGILGAVAGFGIYIYPPTAITVTLFSILTVILVHGKRYLKQIGIFCTVFILIALPFGINHLTNSNTAIIDDTTTLTAGERILYNEALTRAFGGNASIFAVDFEEMKRIVWDQTPLVLLFVASLFVAWQYRDLVGKEKLQISITSVYLLVCTFLFVGGIELLNWYSLSHGGSYVFSEHLRILRGVGFILFMQLIVLLYFFVVSNKRWLAVGIAIGVLVTPIFFFAPLLRIAVRALVPESIRTTYNLAPVVPPSTEKSFSNLTDAALWARTHISTEDTKFFLFTEYQSEFQFKLLSRHDSNLLEKEGATWATTGFANNQKWFSERVHYDTVVEDASSFYPILAFARQLGCTHLLLPRGHFAELYDASGLNLEVLYSNSDYRILNLQ